MSLAVKTELTLGYSPWGTGGGDIKPFDRVFAKKQDGTVSMQGIDAFVLYGGEDIHPSFYGEKHHRYNQAPAHPSKRDIFEWNAVKYCVQNEIPIIGVCRGAQLLCAAAGGKLVQHCTGHTNGGHQVETKWGEVLYTTSAHHQMLSPWNVPHDLIAWSRHQLSNDYEDGDGNTMVDAATNNEPEVVYFPKIRALAIQGHPEWMSDDSPFVKWCNELVVEYLLLKETV